MIDVVTSVKEKQTKKSSSDIMEELRNMLNESKQGSEWQERFTS